MDNCVLNALVYTANPNKESASSLLRNRIQNPWQNLRLRISTRRKTLGISQNDLAEMSGVSLATIKNIERGVGNPSFETVEKILSVLGMEIFFKVRNPFDKQ